MVKHPLFFIFLFTLVGCTNNNKKPKEESPHSPIVQHDSISISETPGIQYRVHKDQYNAIVAVRKEFFSEVPVNPDSSYYSAFISLEEM